MPSSRSTTIATVLLPLLFSLTTDATTTTITTTTGEEKKQPPAWFLAGDSTTALQNPDGGGWGAGFLSFLHRPAWGTDYAVDGSTTVSFVDEGYWGEVLAAVGNATLARGTSSSSRGGNATLTDTFYSSYSPFVTIQFGHNDQKATANISLDEYQTNLENMATEVKEAGGTPILVTPLTRRDFTSEYNLTLNLIDQRLYTIYAAGNTSTWYIDLNKASSEYVETIGNTSAQRYDLNGTDETHLNAWGSVVFGRMVVDLILGHQPDVPSPDVDWVPSPKDWLTQYFVPNQTLSDQIWGGVVA